MLGRTPDVIPAQRFEEGGDRALQARRQIGLAGDAIKDFGDLAVQHRAIQNAGLSEFGADQKRTPALGALDNALPYLMNIASPAGHVRNGRNESFKTILPQNDFKFKMLPSNQTRRMRYRNASVVFLTCVCLLPGNPPPAASTAPDVQAALDGIQASSLRQDLQFIASDELQGRDSPSPGLDRAAEYIADQFRRAGLEPAVNGSYFQQASMLVEQPDLAGFELRIAAGRRQFIAQESDVMLDLPAGIDFKDEPVVKLDGDEKAEDLKGKIVIVERGSRMRMNRILRAAKPALLIVIERSSGDGPAQPHHKLLDAENPGAPSGLPRIIVSADAAARFYAALKSGAGEATATVHIAPPRRTRATLRNVIGVLRGSDPALRDTYVFLTAHYDHLGVKPAGGGDRIYNGANDDGSGTVSVMEIARALGRLPQHPRRSIVFMTLFGEEEGLIGSKYYVDHPVWPLDKTIADLNLEQVGRTDSTEGREISNASLTGFDYSDLTGFLQSAGKRTGVKIYKDAQGSDEYFALSDNFSFARAGIPAETLCVAFDYPDYHAVGDEWQKIDYGNMAKVDRAVALAIFSMADSERPVEWNKANPKAEPYIKALAQRGTQ